MPDHSSNVFVSYSHSDASLVAPVVKLLRVNKSMVFQDIDDIRPGKKWREEIANALAKSDLVVVFWCHHANRSDEVSKEWKVAIEQDKDLLPLLLDNTPLPSELSKFQWIDFRDVVGTKHSGASRLRYRLGTDASPSGQADIPASAQPEPPKKSARSALWVSLVGLIAVIVIATPLIYMSYEQAPVETSVPVEINRPQQSRPPPPEPDAPLRPPYGKLWFPGFIIAATALIVWLFRLFFLKGHTKDKEGDLGIVRVPSEIERHIASELESEILRRTASQQDVG